MFSIVVDSLLSNISRSAQLAIFIPGNLRIILKLFFMLSYSNYSGIIDWSLYATYVAIVINDACNPLDIVIMLAHVIPLCHSNTHNRAFQGMYTILNNICGHLNECLTDKE